MTGPDRGYVICTTPRSGSNFLSQLLTSTGVLGRPLEYFNGPARRVLDHPDYPDDPEAQLAAIQDLGRTPNGVYGFKLFITQFDAIADLGWPRRLPNLSFIYLERRDLVGQAVSWMRATQTGQYRSTSDVAGTAHYDPAAILDRLSQIVMEQARWRGYFALNDIRPLFAIYEDVVADPAQTVGAVGRLMGLASPPRIDPTRIDLTVQRDADTADWRARFIVEHADVTRPTPLDLRDLPPRS